MNKSLEVTLIPIMDEVVEEEVPQDEEGLQEKNGLSQEPEEEKKVED